VLEVTTDAVRLFAHVTAAAVWVGGQLTLAFVVPVVRRVAGRETLRAVARRFQQVAWPAFVVLLATGVWNLFAVDVADADTDYLTTLGVKLGLVAVSGLAAAGHALLAGPRVAQATDDAQARRQRARSGALAGVALLAALGAMFLGAVLRT
jgi:putative copper export protein